MTMKATDLCNIQLAGALKLAATTVGDIAFGETLNDLLQEAADRLILSDNDEEEDWPSSDFDSPQEELNENEQPVPSATAYLILFIEKCSGKVGSWGIFGEKNPTTYEAYHPTVLDEFVGDTYEDAKKGAEHAINLVDGPFHWVQDCPPHNYMGTPKHSKHCKYCGAVTTNPGPNDGVLCAHCHLVLIDPDDDIPF